MLTEKGLYDPVDDPSHSSIFVSGIRLLSNHCEGTNRDNNYDEAAIRNPMLHKVPTL